MARYTGPKTKVSRRLNTFLGGSVKAFERKNYPPGIHGPKGSRRKLSDYAQAMAEKQKLRHLYGVLEKQFRRYFQMARSKKGITGEILLQLLEQRLDNVVFRMGFAKTRAAARQMVAHGHVQVNGIKLDRPSAILKAGDQVTVKPVATSQRLAQNAFEYTQTVPLPEWVQVDREHWSGQLMRIPKAEEIQSNVNIPVVVELYSR